MRINRANVGKLCIRQTKQGMIDRKKYLCNNVIVKSSQEVIHIHNRSGGRILNRKNRIVGASLGDLLHCILKTLHMVDIRIFPEKLKRSTVAVSTLHSLIDDTDIFHLECRNLLKAEIDTPSVLCKQAILIPPADRHNL